MKKIFFLASLLSLTYFSCKSKKETTRLAENTNNAVTTNHDTSITYKLIVSFISKGAGTDSEKRTAFLNYISQHQLKPIYKTVIWGREGETDYCFNLAEFTLNKELATFMTEIKKIAANSDMMIVSENAECRHKGR
jgi:hypothetical protein